MSGAAETDRGRHIVGLDLVRFAAAFSVMAFHYLSWLPALRIDRALPQAPPLSAGLFDAAWAGWVGVQVFFVISGFVIAFSAERADAAGFARSRVLRYVTLRL